MVSHSIESSQKGQSANSTKTWMRMQLCTTKTAIAWHLSDLGLTMPASFLLCVEESWFGLEAVRSGSTDCTGPADFALERPDMMTNDGKACDHRDLWFVK